MDGLDVLRERGLEFFTLLARKLHLHLVASRPSPRSRRCERVRSAPWVWRSSAAEGRSVISPHSCSLQGALDATATKREVDEFFEASCVVGGCLDSGRSSCHAIARIR